MNEKVLNQTAKTSAVEQFLKAERQNGAKNEYRDGTILPKAGANRWHNLITTNATIAIGSRLSNHQCEIYAGNMCVKLNAKRFCYPDLAIVSGEPNFTDSNFDILLNPSIVVEIFSNSMNSFDKMERLESFLAMPSIRECLLVKEDEMRVEHYARQNAKQWIYRIYNERDDVISLDSINCKVSLAEIYTHIKFRETEMSSKAVN